MFIAFVFNLFDRNGIILIGHDLYEESRWLLKNKNIGMSLKMNL